MGAPIFTKSTLIFAKIQPVAGTPLDTVVAADWMEVSDATLTPMESTEVELNLLSDQMGAKMKFQTGFQAKLSFSIDLAGSGTAGTVPHWGVLEQICGKAQIITAATSVKFKPASSGFVLGTLVCFIGGNKHVIRDARGTSKLEIARNGFLKRTYDITGVYVDPTAVNPPVVTKAPRVIPPMLNPANVALSFHGLTDLCLHSASLDDGNEIKFLDLLNCTEQVMITDRKVSGSIEVIADLVSVKNWFTSAKNGETGLMKITIGKTAGNIIEIEAPKVQLLKPDYGDVDGLRSIKLGLNVLPSLGDDDYTVTIK